MTLIDFIRAMPKVELHIHLEGAIAPETLLRLAEGNGVALPASDVAGLQRWYQFVDFPHFVQVYLAIQDCLRSSDDFSLIAYELGADMARQNIRYREATVTPYTHLWQDKGLVAEEIIAGLEDGRQRARRDFAVEIRWIVDIPRDLPEPAGQVTTDMAIAWLERDVVALGLGGNEATSPPKPFAPHFARARAAGLHSAPHAGETAGPASIWSALHDLKAERLGHGVRAIEDPALLAYLKERQIPLEVNPASNICLKVYRSLEQHPIAHLWRMGLNVTINSDDPLLFGRTLTQEYEGLATVFGLDAVAIEGLALNGVRATFLPAADRQRLEREFQAAFADLRRRHDLI